MLSTTIVERIDTPSTKPCQQWMLMLPTPTQIRAARILLGLHQKHLASKAKLGLSTVVDYERERRVVSDDKIAAMQAALESAGIEFLPQGRGKGFGVRLAKPMMLQTRMDV